MKRVLCTSLLCLLPSCVAAIGNTGYGAGSYPKAALPLLQQRVDAAQRILDLRQQHADGLLAMQGSGVVDTGAVTEAQIAVEEARLVLLQCRAELSALQEREHGDDD